MTFALPLLLALGLAPTGCQPDPCQSTARAARLALRRALRADDLHPMSRREKYQQQIAEAMGFSGIPALRAWVLQVVDAENWSYAEIAEVMWDLCDFVDECTPEPNEDTVRYWVRKWQEVPCEQRPTIRLDPGAPQLPYA